MRRRPVLLCSLVAAALLTIVVGAQTTDPQVFINEIHYDNTGTDAGEFVEIAGPAGTDLTGYAIVLYNGNGGAVYDTDALSGTIPDQQNGFGTISLSYPVNGIQNGSPDGIALVKDGAVVQFLSYEGPMLATGGPALGLTSVDIGVSENGSEPVGQSLRLIGSGDTYADFTWAAPAAATPGAINQGQTFGSTPPQPSLAIDDVAVTEGNSGTQVAAFTVSVTAGHSGVSFDIATADGAGASPATTGDGDYVARSLAAVAIPAGQTTYTFEVIVNGDTSVEPDETFGVTLGNPVGAVIGDGSGIGTIVNDDVPPVVSDVVISQVYGGGGNVGATLTNDFIELFNAGATAVDLSGWSVQYASATGTGTWAVTPLTGSIAPGGYYLIQQAAGAGGTTTLPTPDATGAITMAAGAGRVALQVSTAAIVGRCPTGGTADLVGYGPTATCFEGTAPTAATSATVAALRKRGGCYDSDVNGVDFSIGSPTPRNRATAVRTCSASPLSIPEIQGTGTTSPVVGDDIVTTGIVTARKSNGFFLQSPPGSEDGNADTSEGIFVFTSATPAVAVGDAVSARGTVGEFFSLTQLESSLPGDVTVTSTGNPLPSPVTLTPAILDPDGPIAQLERFEGMRVFAASLTSVAPTDSFGEVATVLTGVPRPLREPGISVLDPVPPDPTSGAPDCCIPRFDENPERIILDTEGLLGASVLTVTSNVVLQNVTGPLDFTFGAYKVLPEAPPIAGPNMSGVAVPVPAADEFTFAGFNIENFAGSETRKQKAALAIRQLMRSPDVIGHIEILDLATLQGLAAQVNADAVAAGEPDPGYEALLIPAPSAGNTQNVGFLVKTSRVRVDSLVQEGASETYTNPNNGNQETLHDRPPLVLRATVAPLGPDPHPVIVVVNHLRSFIDIELVAGDGTRVRAKRKAQAESVAALLQRLQTDNPGVAVLSLGDYNAYQFNDGYTDPIATLTGAPTPDDQIVEDESPDLVEPDFINLTDTLPAAERYSFIFEGTPQALDHVLVNTVGAGYVRRYAVARGNADFPETPAALFAGNPARPERSSDHDMPVAFLHFPDLTPPVFGAVSDVSVPATTFEGAVVTYGLPTASDAVDGAVPVTCAPASGTSFLIGSTTVTCTATDAAGNDAQVTFVVTVTLTDRPGTGLGAGQLGADPRVTFSFAAAQTDAGVETGWLLATMSRSRGLPYLFLSVSVDQVTFLDGAVRVTGSGWWNGRGGHTFELMAEDNGVPGAGHDTFSLIVRAPGGAIVLQQSGLLNAGNVQVVR